MKIHQYNEATEILQEQDRLKEDIEKLSKFIKEDNKGTMNIEFRTCSRMYDGEMELDMEISILIANTMISQKMKRIQELNEIFDKL